ncbi:hypothetical protein PLEOSDRAFT_1061813 [Pleurotus ostreatus PC15]|uniref:Cytochrome P450 n=1 Tax=Pleurotus ostreatus (strain PC15) TaxID=1137138 RepID=A0A067NUE1_PLEO1|nr:hypothetical protein PLEOSDRAFT_1061813 [Pleurotus ostreatus PC15]
MVNATNFLVALLSIFLLSRVAKFIKGLKAVSYLPGYRIPFWPIYVPGVLLPTTWWNMGLEFPWRRRFDVYRNFQNESFSVVPWLLGPAGIYTSNVDIARQVTTEGRKSSFFKPQETSRLFLLWGMNLSASEGDTWRRHRRIIAPAFNEDLYNLVWEKTLQTYRDMVDAEGWADRDVAEFPAVQKLTFKLALHVLGHCAFGFPFDWLTPAKLPNGFMSTHEALRIVADTTIFAVVAPRWIYRLPVKWIQEIRIAYEYLAKFMHDQVQDRKHTLNAAVSDKGVRGKDIFTMLVAANQSENDKLKLSDQEVIGNIFLMLSAGHETTAHTLAATLGLISLYEDIQDDVLQQIADVVGFDRDPTLQDYPKLTKVTAVFYESLRMFPIIHLMPREANEDTTLSIPNPVGQAGNTVIPIRKGTQVIVDMIGIQYNPRYFDEPEKFKPSRWDGVSNESEEFTAFSFGPRMCIGRKFALTESVCWLTMLLREWRIEPILQRGETKEEWKRRVMNGRLVPVLAITEVPVRFVRRNRV